MTTANLTTLNNSIKQVEESRRYHACARGEAQRRMEVIGNCHENVMLSKIVTEHHQAITEADVVLKELMSNRRALMREVKKNSLPKYKESFEEYLRMRADNYPLACLEASILRMSKEELIELIGQTVDRTKSEQLRSIAREWTAHRKLQTKEVKEAILPQRAIAKPQRVIEDNREVAE